MTPISSKTPGSSVTPTSSSSPDVKIVDPSKYEDYFNISSSYTPNFSSEYEAYYYANPIFHNKLNEIVDELVGFSGTIDLGEVSYVIPTPLVTAKVTYGASLEVVNSNENAPISISTDLSASLEAIGNCINSNGLDEIGGVSDVGDLSINGMSLSVGIGEISAEFEMPDGKTKIKIATNGPRNLEIITTRTEENDDYGTLETSIGLELTFNGDIYPPAEPVQQYEPEPDYSWVTNLALSLAVVGTAVGASVLTGGTATPAAGSTAVASLALIWGGSVYEDMQEKQENTNDGMIYQ